MIEPLPAGRRAGAFFDLEKTLHADAVEQTCALVLHRRGQLETKHLMRVLWIYLRYNLGLIANFERMKRAGAVLFVGRDHAADRAAMAELMASGLGARLFPQARALVDELRAKGYRIYIVSSTYAFIVEPFAAALL